MHRLVETWRVARRIVARAAAVLWPASAGLDLPIAVGEVVDLRAPQGARPPRRSTQTWVAGRSPEPSPGPSPERSRGRSAGSSPGPSPERSRGLSAGSSPGPSPGSSPRRRSRPRPSSGHRRPGESPCRQAYRRGRHKIRRPIIRELSRATTRPTSMRCTRRGDPGAG